MEPKTAAPPLELRTGPRILVVDDVPDMLKMTAWLLKVTWPQAAVWTARNGRIAQRKLEAMRPDLLVTDLNLPVLSGIELCRWVRENRDLVHTKVIAMTGYDSADLNWEALKNGADEYIPKPFSAAEFRSSARRLLGLEGL